MTQLPPEDPRLSAFLRRYRPAPPSGSGDLEDYLLARIERDVQQESKGAFWILSGAVLAGMIMGWGVYNYSNRPQLPPSTAELEHFLLESWNNRTLERTYTNENSSLTGKWLLLTSPNPNFIVSAPQ